MAKILHSEVFIFLDDFQFARNKWINACVVRNRKETIQLTVPVGHHLAPINRIKVADGQWNRKVFRTLQQSYRRAPRWVEHEAFLKDYLLQLPGRTLDEFNIAGVRYCLGDLDYQGRLLRSGQMGHAGKGVGALVDLLKRAGATQFLNAKHGIDGYMSGDQHFRELPPLVCWKWDPPNYCQMGAKKRFQDLSIMDLLMNYPGRDAAAMLKVAMSLEPYVP